MAEKIESLMTNVYSADFTNLIVNDHRGSFDSFVVSGNLTFNSDYPGRNINIANSEFSDTFSFDRYNVHNDFIFVNCFFGKNDQKICLKSSGIQGETLTFCQCTFKNEIEFNDSDIRQINFNGCIFENDISFIRGGKSTSISFNNFSEAKNSVKANIKFYNAGLSRLMIRDTNVTRNIEFHSGNIDNIFFGDGIYNSINFYNYKNLKRLTIQGLTENRDLLSVKTISAPYLKLDGAILFQNMKVAELLDLGNFDQNEGAFKIQNVEFSNKLIIRDADLGRILFNEVNFTAAKISFDNSYIGKCIFSNILWPEGKRMYSFKQISGIPTNNELKNTLILKEVYRQMKDVLKSQSSNIDALDFYRNEMREYYKEITVHKTVGWWDRWIVRINKWSSDFGLSLKKPFWGIFIFHFIFFTILVLRNYEDLTINFNFFSWHYFFNGLGDFLLLINPVHKSIETNDGVIKIVDFLMRIFSGFFIYHIIKATRKNNRI